MPSDARPERSPVSSRRPARAVAALAALALLVGCKSPPRALTGEEACAEPPATVAPCQSDADCRVVDLPSCCHDEHGVINGSEATAFAAWVSRCRRAKMICPDRVCPARSRPTAACVASRCVASAGPPVLSLSRPTSADPFDLDELLAAGRQRASALEGCLRSYAPKGVHLNLELRLEGGTLRDVKVASSSAGGRGDTPECLRETLGDLRLTDQRGAQVQWSLSVSPR